MRDNNGVGLGESLLGRLLRQLQKQIPPGRYSFELEGDGGSLGSLGEHELAAGQLLELRVQPQERR